MKRKEFNLKLFFHIEKAVQGENPEGLQEKRRLFFRNIEKFTGQQP